jgi:hypothetical protein
VLCGILSDLRGAVRKNWRLSLAGTFSGVGKLQNLGIRVPYSFSFRVILILERISHITKIAFLAVNSPPTP